MGMAFGHFKGGGLGGFGGVGSGNGVAWEVLCLE